jgi:hypothetical protein
MLLICIILSIALTMYFFLAWQIAISLPFSVINLFFLAMLKYLNIGHQKSSFSALLLYTYTSSSLLFLLSLEVYHFVFRDKIRGHNNLFADNGLNSFSRRDL